jgi:hypothetical protein
MCEENPKEHPEGKWCTSCKDEFKESDEDLTNDDDNEIIK